MNPLRITHPEYRYTLRRTWDPEIPYPFDGDAPDLGVVCWILLNPSTADDEADDQTVRKITHISKAHGYDGLIVVNLFATRATKPKYLRQMTDPVGPDNDWHISEAIEESHAIVCGWGAHDLRWSLQPEFVRGRIARETSVPVLCCGTNADGSPKHPCYLANDTQLVPFEVGSCPA